MNEDQVHTSRLIPISVLALDVDTPSVRRGKTNLSHSDQARPLRARSSGISSVGLSGTVPTFLLRN